MLYICIKLCENISKGFRVLRFSKRHNSVKNVGGVSVFNLCTSSDGALYLYQVSWKYLILSGQGFCTKFSRGIILSKCRWSYGPCSNHITWWCSIFEPKFMKISQRVLELLSRHDLWRSHSQPDGHTNRQLWEKQYVSPRGRHDEYLTNNFVKLRMLWTTRAQLFKALLASQYHSTSLAVFINQVH